MKIKSNVVIPDKITKEVNRLIKRMPYDRKHVKMVLELIGSHGLGISEKLLRYLLREVK